MRLAPMLLAVLAAPALSSALRAEDVNLLAPVYSQVVISPVPDGFVSVYEHAEGGSYIHEAVPAAETAARWTQMITLTGAEGQIGPDPGQSLITAAQTFANAYKAICPASFTLHQYAVDNVAGAQGSLAVLLGCGTIEVPEHSPDGPGAEAVVVVFAAGSRDIYTFQWAEHFAPEAGAQTYDPEAWQPRLDKLIAGSKLCHPVPGEQPPYKSCTE